MRRSSIHTAHGPLGGIALTILVAVMFFSGCNDKSTGANNEYNPIIDPADFVSEVTNPFFPLTPGQTFIYEGESEDGPELVEVRVSDQTREIMGVTCVVVEDRVWVNDILAEETYDWYAQDSAGNVWYFGELAINYEDGTPVNTDGSWEAGVDEAKPGIIMEAQPLVGDTYRQEYYPEVAEDMAEVLSLSDSMTVPYGHFENCLRTRDWTPLEAGVAEEKLYASGIGNIATIQVEGGNDYTELVDVTVAK
jgi:hypothetical protein